MQSLQRSVASEGNIAGIYPVSVAVFWDIENCSVPSGIPPEKTVGALRDYAFHWPTATSFVRIHVYGSVPSLNIAQALVSCGAHWTPLANEARRKDGADLLLLSDLMGWCLDNRSARIILVAGDLGYARALNILASRGFKIRLLCANAAQYVPHALASAVERVDDWRHVATGRFIRELNFSSSSCELKACESSAFENLPMDDPQSALEALPSHPTCSGGYKSQSSSVPQPQSSKIASTIEEMALKANSVPFNCSGGSIMPCSVDAFTMQSRASSPICLVKAHSDEMDNLTEEQLTSVAASLALENMLPIQPDALREQLAKRLSISAVDAAKAEVDLLKMELYCVDDNGNLDIVDGMTIRKILDVMCWFENEKVMPCVMFMKELLFESFGDVMRWLPSPLGIGSTHPKLVDLLFEWHLNLSEPNSMDLAVVFPRNRIFQYVDPSDPCCVYSKSIRKAVRKCETPNPEVSVIGAIKMRHSSEQLGLLSIGNIIHLRQLHCKVRLRDAPQRDSSIPISVDEAAEVLSSILSKSFPWGVNLSIVRELLQGNQNSKKIVTFPSSPTLKRQLEQRGDLFRVVGTNSGSPSVVPRARVWQRSV